jgi:hypothetical protein
MEFTNLCHNRGYEQTLAADRTGQGVIDIDKRSRVVSLGEFSAA